MIIIAHKLLYDITSMEVDLYTVGEFDFGFCTVIFQ